MTGAHDLPVSMTVELQVFSDRARQAALVRIGDEQALLKPGEWSGWIPLHFKHSLPLGSTPGMVRIFLRALSPEVVRYTSPLNIDPAQPAMPISSPRGFSRELVEAGAGKRFDTLGIPEDTKGLVNGFLSEEDFLRQVDEVYASRRELLFQRLSEFRQGFLFAYFGTIDMASHMFFASLDPNAPPEMRKYQDVLPRLYEKFDQLLGAILAQLPEGTRVIVMSDHGFAGYKWKVHLNKWLLDRGYLFLKNNAEAGTFDDIDWSRTQVYNVGFNQLYVNLQGRERWGIVERAKAATVVERVRADLDHLVDGNTGAKVVTRTERPAAGNSPERQPNLTVGFNRLDRNSDESTVGATPGGAAIVANNEKWNGDHCIDPAQVPGVFLSNARLVGALPTGGPKTDRSGADHHALFRS